MMPLPTLPRVGFFTSVARRGAALLATAALACSAAAAERFAAYKSTDGGQSWQRADAGLGGRARVNAFGFAEGVLLAGTDAGILVSTDAALTWRPAGGTAAGARTLSFATAGKKVFAGTSGSGLLVSGDGGRSWSPQPALPARKVRSLLAHEGTLYAGTDAEGVFASRDEGETWAQLPGLPAGAQVFALAAAGGRVFAGLYSRGLFGWDAGARAWSRAGEVTPLALASAAGTLIAGHNPGGLHWSTDLGASWAKGAAATAAPKPPAAAPKTETSGELHPEAPVWELAAGEHGAIAGAAAGIYLSRDRGRTWLRARGGLPADSPGIAFLVKEGIILAATWHQESAGGAPAAARAR